VTTPEAFNRSVRDLLAVVRVADLDRVETLTELQDSIDLVTRALEPETVEGERMQAALVLTDDMVGMPSSFVAPNEFFPYSPVLGNLNPISPVANFDIVDGEIRGQVTLGATHNGPPGSVHGGMIALVMDELLGCACLAAGLGGFTGTLSIRYQATVPLDTSIELHGWVDRQEGRKVFAKGELRLGDRVLTTAVGIFIRSRESAT